MKVRVSADLSYSGTAYWKEAEIDSCIVRLVEALQKAGIDMRTSCCGHGCGWGHIGLQDGRQLLITDERYLTQPARWIARLLWMLVTKDLYERWRVLKMAGQGIVKGEQSWRS